MAMTIGERLKLLRKASHLRQDQVAKILGVERNTVSQYENGNRIPPVDIVIHFADVYGVSTDYILGLDRAQSIDVTGLTHREIALLTCLVEIMKEKGSSSEK